MDTPIFKRSVSTVKLSGLGNLDIEHDKIENDIEAAYKRHEEEEKLKEQLRNKHLDPLYMESDLPESPDTGSISLDPNDMTFDFK